MRLDIARQSDCVEEDRDLESAIYMEQWSTLLQALRIFGI